MANGILGEILGSVLGGGRAAQPGSQGDGRGGLGDVLGGVLGRGGQGYGTNAGSPLGGGRGALVAMLLPLAMQWVQRNGGIGGVLQRFQQKGYGQQASSWMSTGANAPIAPQEVSDVVGMDELSRMSQQLGVPHQEVASGLSEILPQMVDHLTPDGTLRPDADEALDNGRSMLERFLGQAGGH